MAQVKYRIVNPAGQVRHEFNAPESDDIPNEAFKWLLKNQSCSVHEALVNQGWRVERFGPEYVIESAWSADVGYEETCACEDRMDALQTLEDYQKNEPGVPHRMRLKRTWITLLMPAPKLRHASVPLSFIDEVGSFSAIDVLDKWDSLTDEQKERWQ